jgi:hypothetical protein
VFISHDEIVMNLGDDQELAYQKAQIILKAMETIKENRVKEDKPWMSLGTTVFIMNKISKGIYAKTIFFLTNDSLVQSHKTLFGCPGNVYYMNFKKYILEKEVEEKDCLFFLDNRLAKWVI